MKLSTKKREKNSLGCFITLGDSLDEKAHVQVTANSHYFISIHIEFPHEMNGSKLPILRAAINRIGRGTSIPVRLNYDNLVKYISLEELSLLENAMQNASFYIYQVPKEILPELTSSLDVHSIQNKIRRINDREKRQQHILNRAALNLQGE